MPPRRYPAPARRGEPATAPVRSGLVTVVVVIEAVAIVLLALAVVAVRRTHAKNVAVLRGGNLPGGLSGGAPPGAGGTRAPGVGGTPAPPGTDDPLSTRLPRAGDPAPPLVGVDPRGLPASWTPSGPAVLAFLTGECLPCRWWWQQLAGPAARLLPEVVVVTPDPSTDDPAQVAQLAGDELRVVMASDAWAAYGVGGAGTFVAVRDGKVAAAGGAEGWDGLVALVAAPLAG